MKDRHFHPLYTVNVYNESDRKEEGYYEKLGITPDTSTYYAYYTCGILGSCLIQDVWDKAVSEEEKMFPKQQNDSAKLSPAFGFTLNTDNVKTEVTAITNVENQFKYGLIYGELDPEVYIPQFIEALEGAGINHVIAEAQTQLDAWAAAK